MTNPITSKSRAKSDRHESNARPGKPLVLIASGGAFALLALALVLGVHGSDAIREWANESWGLLQTMPAWIYFLTMAVVCILPVPISPFYLAAGPLFGISTSIVWIGIGVALNQAAAYFLASGVMRPVIARQLGRMGYSIATVASAEDQWLFTFLLRAVPGVPYALQNWILGLAGIERLRYFVISWPIQMMYALAWLVAGESAFEGRYGMMVVAVAVILAIALIGRWIGIRAKRSRADLMLASDVAHKEENE